MSIAGGCTPGAARWRRQQAAGALRHRDFRLLWGGQLVSNLGDAASALALSWLVQEQTHSAVMVGAVITAFAAPMILAAPVVGLVLDRVDKRGLMVWRDLIRAGLIGLLATLYELGHLTMAAVPVFALAAGTATAFFEPARQASLIYLVQEEELPQANALSMLTRQIAQLAGPAVAGLAVARWGVAATLWFHAVSYGLSALALASMRWRSTVRPQQEPGLRGALHDLKAGLSLIAGHPLLCHIFALAVLVNFAMAPVAVLLPLYAQSVLRDGPVGLGVVQGAMGAGMLAGSLVMSSWGGRWRKGPTGILGLWGMALSMLAASMSRKLGWAAAAFLAWGACNPLVNVPVVTLVQHEVPAERQGQAFAGLMAATVAAQPLGMAIGGLVGDRWGASTALLAVSAALGITSLMATSSRRLRLAR